MDEYKLEYESLFSKLNCAFLIINADADLTIYFANPAFYRSLGVTAEEVKYRFANRLSAMLDSKVTKALHDFVENQGGGTYLSLEHTLRGKKSAHVWFITEVNGLFLKETGRLLLVCFNIDRYKSKEQMYLSRLSQSGFLIKNGGFNFLE